jgi:uncharacterized protein
MFELPLFPLDTVLFPGMPLRLHIFEERYRVMIQRVMATSHTFGVALIRSGLEAHGPLPQPHLTGCTARIVQIDAQEDGTLDLTAVGDERFRVLRLGTAQPYLTAFVESVPLQAHHTIDVVRGTHRLRRLLARYLKLISELAKDEEEEQALELDMNLSELQLPEDPMMLIYLSAALLQVPAREKQPLLEADTAARLLALVQRLYRRELAVLPPLMAASDEQAHHSAWVN